MRSDSSNSCHKLVVNVITGIVYVSLFRLVLVQDFVYESSNDLAVGSKCKFDRNDSVGMCRDIRNCPGAIRDFRDHNIPPTTCSVTPDNHPIVCCGFKRRYDAYCNYHYGEPETAHLCFVLAAGGTRTKPGEFPHMTALGWRYGSGTQWKCGGSMIRTGYVLTAAHCTVDSNGMHPNIVRIGDENLLTDDGQWIFDVNEIIVHPEYRAPVYYNDIALIKFGGDAMQFEYIQGMKPVCLPPEKLINYGEDFFDKVHWSPPHALGYGATSFGGPTDDTHLNKVWIDMFSADRCYRDFPPDENIPRGILNATQICAGDDKGIRDTCQGDSGGPLQRRFDLHQPRIDDTVHWYYVFGITSFGRSCATGAPGIYTRITPYLDWIESIVWPTEIAELGTNLTHIFGRCWKL